MRPPNDEQQVTRTMPTPLARRPRSNEPADSAADALQVVRERRRRAKQRAPAGKSRARGRRPALANRRRRNVPRLLLRLLALALVAECAAALLFSPRLWVRTLRIEGNSSIPTRRIAARLDLQEQTNIVRLSVDRLRTRVLAEPAIQQASVKRRLPGTLVVSVRERTPWAVVQATSGACYIVDQTLVPFRKTSVPDADLPLVRLALARESEPVLGKQIIAPGLREATICLRWAAAHTAFFPLASVSVDRAGKLCLNRRGTGTQIRLGSGVDLAKKLDTLVLLLARRPDLRAGTVSSVNLFAHDAPALLVARSDPSSPAAPPEGITNP